MRAHEVTDAESLTTLGDTARVLFSRPGPRLIAATAGTLWGLRCVLGPPGPMDVVAAAAAIAVWPFQEWVLHKHVLHWRPRTVLGAHVDPLFARRHREHHEAPRDVDGVLLPPAVIAGAIPFAAAGWLAAFGPTRAAITGMATYSSMALLYEWTHLLVHTGYKPRSAFAKRVRRNHHLHHFRSEHHWFAFTLPHVDAWLGTDPDPATTPRSKTAMDLHGLRASASR